MVKVGITGQNGFIGGHLYNTLRLRPGAFSLVEFNKDYFFDTHRLDSFVSSCDVIVHLAGMNRHEDPDVIYQTNIGLAVNLIESLTRTNSSPHIIFSSSTQEQLENLYGKSKKESRVLFETWANSSESRFTSLIIPNVFGPFGRPFYNSVISTFCYQLTHNDTPSIINDGELRLIYIGELIDKIILLIEGKSAAGVLTVDPTAQIKVSKMLEMLHTYRQLYCEKGSIPPLENAFSLNLFNTFRSYITPQEYFPVKLTQNIDVRGSFVEVIRLNVGGQVSFSTTAPGVTRGNHFHTRKIERFAVIKGHALIQFRKVGTTEVFNFELDGNSPAYVDMPIWYTHNIKNVGDDELYTIFWINEPFNPNDADTYFETV